MTNNFDITAAIITIISNIEQELHESSVDPATLDSIAIQLNTLLGITARMESQL